MTRRDLILGNVRDLVSSLLWYDRGDDEELPRGELEKAIEAGEVTVDELCDTFTKRLREELE